MRKAWVILVMITMTSQSLVSNTIGKDTAMEVTGKIIKENFIGKNGKISDKFFDLFLLSGPNKYFIKSCESKVSRSEMQKLIGKELRFKIEKSEGTWDKCDEIEVQSRVGPYVKILDVVRAPAEMLMYADGNGNVYKISEENIEYIPVQKENSSSGLYSGGNPVAKSITPDAWKNIQKEFEAVFSNKKIQIKNRVMGSGLLSWAKKGKDSTVYISDGPEKQTLEKNLKKLLGI